MGVESGFFDKQPDGTDAEYREDQASVVFGAAVPDGLSPLSDDNGAATVAGDGSGVLIAAGTIGFAKGFYFKITDEDFPVAVDAADASPRIDRIVARLDRSANSFQPHYLKGTAGSVTSPTLTRDDDIYDLRMWLVTRGTNGSLTLTEDRDWGALEIHATQSGNRPPSNVGYGFEWETDTGSLIRRDGSGARLVLLEDSGDLTLTSAQANWAVRDPGCHARHLNRRVDVEINMERVNSTLGSPADTDGSNLVRLPTALRPSREHYFSVNLTAGKHGRLDVQPDGFVVLRHIDSDVTAGRFLRADISFLVG